MNGSLKIFASAALACGLIVTAYGKTEKAGRPAPAAGSTIRMATEATFPPYEYFENGKIVGIDVEIVSEICKNIGYKFEAVDMKFDSVILAVQTDKCELAGSGITVTEDRKKQINFSYPYVTAAQVIIVPVNSAIAGPDDLKPAKIRIGVQQGTTGDAFVAKNLHEPQRYDNAGLAVAALLAGKLEAVVCDGEPAKVHASKHPEVKILPMPLTSEEYAFAFNKQDVELLKKFNAELLKMYKDGRLQAILDKYLGENK